MTEPGDRFRSRAANGNIHAEHEVETEAAEVREPQPNDGCPNFDKSCSALRNQGGGQNQHQAAKQLKEDRTKSFLLLAGLTVVLSLAFFAMFSTPNSRKNIAEADHPNLGRAQNA